MIRAVRSLALVLPLVLAACAETGPGVEVADTGPVPVAFRIELAGATGPVLGEDGAGALELARDGADASVGLAFENGSLAVHPLAPGRYEVTRLGPLQCRGLAFEVGAQPRYLGTLRATVIRTDYHVALMQPAVAVPADVAALAERADVDTEAVDARPLAVNERAPCFLSQHGPPATWEDFTLKEKIILGAGIVGLCTISLAAGGFCQF